MDLQKRASWKQSLDSFLFAPPGKRVTVAGPVAGLGDGKKKAVEHTLLAVIVSPVLESLRRFLAKRFMVETLELLIAVLDYEAAPSPEAGMAVVRRFIGPDAPDAVTMALDVAQSMEAAAATGAPSAFQPAKEESLVVLSLVLVEFLGSKGLPSVEECLHDARVLPRVHAFAKSVNSEHKLLLLRKVLEFEALPAGERREEIGRELIREFFARGGGGPDVASLPTSELSPAMFALLREGQMRWFVFDFYGRFLSEGLSDSSASATASSSSKDTAASARLTVGSPNTRRQSWAIGGARKGVVASPLVSVPSARPLAPSSLSEAATTADAERPALLSPRKRTSYVRSLNELVSESAEEEESATALPLDALSPRQVLQKQAGHIDQSLFAILINSRKREQFRAFLSARFMDDYLVALLAVLDWEVQPDVDGARLLFDRFVAPGGPEAVTLASDTIEDLRRQVEARSLPVSFLRVKLELSVALCISVPEFLESIAFPTVENCLSEAKLFSRVLAFAKLSPLPNCQHRLQVLRAIRTRYDVAAAGDKAGVALELAREYAFDRVEALGLSRVTAAAVEQLGGVRSPEVMAAVRDDLYRFFVFELYPAFLQQDADQSSSARAAVVAVPVPASPPHSPQVPHSRASSGPQRAPAAEPVPSSRMLGGLTPRSRARRGSYVKSLGSFVPNRASLPTPAAAPAAAAAPGPRECSDGVDATLLSIVMSDGASDEFRRFLEARHMDDCLNLLLAILDYEISPTHGAGAALYERYVSDSSREAVSLALATRTAIAAAVANGGTAPPSFHAAKLELLEVLSLALPDFLKVSSVVSLEEGLLDDAVFARMAAFARTLNAEPQVQLLRAMVQCDAMTDRAEREAVAMPRVREWAKAHRDALPLSAGSLELLLAPGGWSSAAYAKLRSEQLQFFTLEFYPLYLQQGRSPLSPRPGTDNDSSTRLTLRTSGSSAFNNEQLWSDDFRPSSTEESVDATSPSAAGAQGGSKKGFLGGLFAKKPKSSPLPSASTSGAPTLASSSSPSLLSRTSGSGGSGAPVKVTAESTAQLQLFLDAAAATGVGSTQKTLLAIVSFEGTRNLFRKFLEVRFMADELQCLISVLEYETAPSPERARQLYERFVMENAEMQITLEHSLASRLKADLARGEATLFTEVKNEVLGMMSTVLAEFLESHRMPTVEECLQMPSVLVFACQHHSEANVLFLRAVAAFEALSSDREREAMAGKMVKKFFNSSSPHEINVSGRVVKSVSDAMAARDFRPTMFAKAKEDQSKLFVFDTYLRYLATLF